MSSRVSQCAINQDHLEIGRCSSSAGMKKDIKTRTRHPTRHFEVEGWAIRKLFTMSDSINPWPWTPMNQDLLIPV
ncbi:hypothetical protein RSAG8_02608, partial [Rhizoctonia solani AG-8 WAC10335]